MFVDLTPEQRQLQAELRQYFSDLISPEEAKEMETDRHGKAYRALIRRMGQDGKLGSAGPRSSVGTASGRWNRASSSTRRPAPTCRCRR
jgi:3-oxo-4-pregnene-20-carboxyl-CoA dehydrogenase beta subunit